MRHSLFAEAETLYRDAKLASFAGRFDEADAKHTSSALIFEYLQEPDLAARALMRGVWYKIQNHTTSELEKVIDRAEILSKWETVAGLHQALEFALLEGEETCFTICVEKFEKLTARSGVKLPPTWADPDLWGTSYCAVGVQIYQFMVQNRAADGHKSWMWSDRARLLYFRAALEDLATRTQVLADAASKFEGHEIRYRSQLCEAESKLWSSCLSPSLFLAGTAAEEALMITRAVATFSLGVSGYARLLGTLAEIELCMLIQRGYRCNQISLNSVHPPVDILKHERWLGGNKIFWHVLVRILSRDPNLLNWLYANGISSSFEIIDTVTSCSSFDRSRLSYLHARAGEFVTPSLSDLSMPSLPAPILPRPPRLVTTDFVHVLVNKESRKEAKTVVVFVHGWRGHQIETWGNFAGLLESDEECQETEMFFWGFPTGFAGNDPGSSIVAESLYTELRNRFPRYRLVLIGHSFGGIVIKKMLVQCDDETLQRIKHVILFATPHLGTNIANFAAQFSNQIKELRVDSEMLTTLEREWVKRTKTSIHAGEIKLTNVRGLEDKLVSDWSASTVTVDSEVVIGSHTSIVKPQSRDFTSYVIVKRRILEAINGT